MKGYFLTDQGQIRPANEDAGGVFFNRSGQTLAIVADGMGGHKAGEVASGLAVQCMTNSWENAKGIKTANEAEQFIQLSLEEMNEQIYQHALDKPSFSGMGTTVVAAICLEEFITIGHVGDSRAYLYQDGVLKQQTNDHSLVNELVRTGQISEADAEVHPRKNVLTRAIGTEEKVESDVRTINWSKQDSLLLCSDGLTNKITNEDLQSYFKTIECKETLVKELTHAANERGGEDNITLTIVDHDGEVGDPSC